MWRRIPEQAAAMRGVSQGVDSPEDELEANKPLSNSAATISIESCCSVSVDYLYHNNTFVRV